MDCVLGKLPRLIRRGLSDAMDCVPLQNEVWRAQSVKVWLVELIGNGKAAEVALEEHS